MNFKKYLIGIGFLTFGFFGVATVYSTNQNTNPFYYDGGKVGTEAETSYGELIKEDAVSPKDSLLNRLMEVFELNTGDYHGPQKAFYYIRKILNYALGFVSLIALGLLLYSFYGMLVGDGDKQYTKVKETLKGIAIAIIVMGVARLIVSMLFWIYAKKALVP